MGRLVEVKRPKGPSKEEVVDVDDVDDVDDVKKVCVYIEIGPNLKDLVETAIVERGSMDAVSNIIAAFNLDIKGIVESAV